MTQTSKERTKGSTKSGDNSHVSTHIPRTKLNTSGYNEKILKQNLSRIHYVFFQFNPNETFSPAPGVVEVRLVGHGTRESDPVGR